MEPGGVEGLGGLKPPQKNKTSNTSEMGGGAKKDVVSLNRTAYLSAAKMISNIHTTLMLLFSQLVKGKDSKICHSLQTGLKNTAGYYFAREGAKYSVTTVEKLHPH